MEIGEYVKSICEKRGLAAADLARLSGLTPGYISLLLRSKRTRLTSGTIAKLSKALSIPVTEFYKILTSDTYVIKKYPVKSLKDLTFREIGQAYIEVPIVADMHAPGHISEYIYLPRTGTSHTKLYGVKVIGNCLAPAVHDGDIVIIDKEDLDYHGKKILCYHNNKEHPEIIKYKNPADLETCEVYGVILWVMKKL